jgi:hypothetical protein
VKHVARRLRDATREHVRRRADPAGAPGEHRGDEHAAVPDDDPVVVPRRCQPAGLVQERRRAAEEPAQLAAVPDARQQPEQVTGFGRRHAESRQRPTSRRREVDGTGEARQVPGARVLANAEPRLALHPDRDRRACGRPAHLLLDLVAAVHQRVAELERPQELLDPPGAADPREQPVRRLVVGAHEHRVQERLRLAAGCRFPLLGAEHGDRDRELERGGCREVGARVPGRAVAAREILDVDRARPRERPGQRPDAAGEAGVQPRCERARRRDGRQPDDALHDGRGAASGRSHCGDAHGHLAQGQLDTQRETPPAQRQVGQHTLADPDDHAPGSRRRRTCHEPEGDLPRRGRDNGRGWQGRSVEHGPIMLAP